MEKTLIEKYKKQLEEERKEVLAEIEAKEKVEDFGSDIDHLEEAADQSEEAEENDEEKFDLEKRLDEIDLALNKIIEGKYGICEKCGKEIEKEVLDIDPESRFCKSCKIKK